MKSAKDAQEQISESIEKITSSALNGQNDYYSS